MVLKQALRKLSRIAKGLYWHTLILSLYTYLLLACSLQGIIVVKGFYCEDNPVRSSYDIFIGVIASKWRGERRRHSANGAVLLSGPLSIITLWN